ncbi:MAG: TolC family protein [Cytophagales bacterium]|nr:MAG: TolC family protein [Cytophagales bacterium]
MKNYQSFPYKIVITLSLLLTGCNLPKLTQKTINKNVPESFINSKDTLNTAKIKWKSYFNDPYLIALIDTALSNNQELNIMTQEIKIANNEVRARKGAYLPFLTIGSGVSSEKVSRYTSQGASDNITSIRPGKPTPANLPNYLLGMNASWELDIWKKLRNSKKSAVHQYLASVEGKNFMVTNLIAEISSAYYELLALDNQLEILMQNIEVQNNALKVVKLQKIAARVSELAVRKFEAEVLKNQSLQYNILQSITETENRINFLIGGFPKKIPRNSLAYIDIALDTIHAGIPVQLLENRPDIRQAEQDLLSADLNVKTTKANFYPILLITSGIGLEAFDPKFLIKTPESALFSIAGSLISPLINRNAIKANYYSANSRQIQAVYNYERSILNAHIEMVNQLSNLQNSKSSFDLKEKEVDTLNQSIDISINLFKSARADYMEVLLTQRDALIAKFELVESKMNQLHAKVNIYRSLGGGWN